MVVFGEDELVAIVRHYAVETHGPEWADKVIDPDADLATLGLDSVDAVLLSSALEDAIGATLDPAFLIRHGSINGVIAEMKRLALIRE